MKRLLGILALVSVAVLCGFGQFQMGNRGFKPAGSSGPSLPAPIAQWKFCGDATCTPSGSTSVPDATGNGNSGTWIGTQYGTNNWYGAATDGQPYAGTFNSPTYVDFTGTSIASVVPTAFTVSVWIDVASWTSFYGPYFCSQCNTGNAHTWGLFNEAGNGVVIVANNATTLIAPTSSFVSGWNNVIGTWDGTTPKLYVNGVSVGVSHSDTNYGIGASTAEIGGGGSNWINALENNVTIYGVALTSAQALALCQAQKGPLGVC